MNISSLRFPVVLALATLITAILFWVMYQFIATPKLWASPKIAPMHFVRLEIEPAQKVVLPQTKPIDCFDCLITDYFFTQPISITRPSLVEPDVKKGITAIKAPAYTGGSLDTEPLVRVNPVYPQSARDLGQEGWVRIRFNIDSTGGVSAPVVVGSQPRGVFDKAAINAVALWRYEPKTEDGVAVEQRGLEVLFRFTLHN
ncbi:MAG TPA: energy transducer TonB [Candidatus Acidoferrum sp.]|nr:energy transducer TonB [Candidatus Acidoferrum sp.]